METRGLGLLKLSFAIGTVADAIVAGSWFAIAAGVGIPNMLCGLQGTGEHYRFAMFIAALFVTGWTAILAWGWLQPFARKGLLLITAVMLAASVVLEMVFWNSLLGGPGFVFGVALRVALVAKFSFSYFYSREGP